MLLAIYVLLKPDLIVRATRERLHNYGLKGDKKIICALKMVSKLSVEPWTLNTHSMNAIVVSGSGLMASLCYLTFAICVIK